MNDSLESPLGCLQYRLTVPSGQHDCFNKEPRHRGSATANLPSKLAVRRLRKSDAAAVANSPRRRPLARITLCMAITQDGGRTETVDKKQTPSSSGRGGATIRKTRPKCGSDDVKTIEPFNPVHADGVYSTSAADIHFQMRADRHGLHPAPAVSCALALTEQSPEPRGASSVGPTYRSGDRSY